MLAALVQHRPMAARRPSATEQGSHQQPTFIDNYQVRSTSARFFLRRGHSVCNHWAIASGFLSRGTRSGLWGEKPWARSQRARYRRLKTMSHSSRIRSASRRLVHNSVSKPCSVGLSSSQRRTIFSWVRVSLRGRPGIGRANNPDRPCRRYANSKRRTLLASTPRNSATSP